jgi:hypothetical protein
LGAHQFFPLSQLYIFTVPNQQIGLVHVPVLSA